MVKISKNLHHNLIPRPGESKPRIELAGVNDWRVIWTLVELLKTRGYQVDAPGFIETSFKEIHGIFSDGLKWAKAIDTVKAFEELAARTFNLVLFKGEDPKGNHIFEPLGQKSLFAYVGNFREVQKIQLNRIFYYETQEKYYSFPDSFPSILAETIRKIGGAGAKIATVDILLYLYVKKYQHTKRERRTKTLEEIATWAGMDADIKKGNWKRITETIERSAKSLKALEMIQGSFIENGSMTFHFRPCSPKAEAGEKGSASKVALPPRAAAEGSGAW